MRTSTNNRRRTQLRVELLEGKTLLSTGSAMHEAAHHVTAAPIVAQAAAPFSGTLAGRYSNVFAPYFAYILNYATSGTLSGPGSTHLAGTLFVRPGAPAGRFDGRLVLHNPGGTMILNVYSTATLGTYTYKVAFAGGSDTSFRGGTGTLTINQTPTIRVPYYVSGHATMTFS
jgi:hypothetical protein